MLKSIIYFAITLIAYIIPFHVLSFASLDDFGFIIGFTFSLLFTVFFCYFFSSVIKKKDDTFGVLVIIIGAIVLVIYAVQFNGYLDRTEYKHYAKYGKFTVGTITNGVHEYTDKNRMGTSVLSINFTTENDSLITVFKQINSFNFDGHYKQEEIPLMYCTNEPKRVKIFESQEELEQFTQAVNKAK
jgi:hypothetical protein